VLVKRRLTRTYWYSDFFIPVTLDPDTPAYCTCRGFVFEEARKTVYHTLTSPNFLGPLFSERFLAEPLVSAVVISMVTVPSGPILIDVGLQPNANTAAIAFEIVAFDGFADDMWFSS